MDEDTTGALTLELDQLNDQRAVMKDGSTALTISRSTWDQLGRPAALQVMLNADRP